MSKESRYGESQRKRERERPSPPCTSKSRKFSGWAALLVACSLGEYRNPIHFRKETV